VQNRNGVWDEVQGSRLNGDDDDDDDDGAKLKFLKD
jgi:hypothetical protein